MRVVVGEIMNSYKRLGQVEEAKSLLNDLLIRTEDERVRRIINEHLMEMRKE